MSGVNPVESSIRMLPPDVLRVTALAILNELTGPAPSALAAALAKAAPPEGGPVDHVALVATMPSEDILAALVASLHGLDAEASAAVSAIALRLAIEGDAEDEDDDDQPPLAVATPIPEAVPRREPARRITRRQKRPVGAEFVLAPGEKFLLGAFEKHAARTVTIERRLAEGGGGIVYLARDEGGRPLIAKTGKVCGEVPRSLLIEREVLAPLDHQNLVRLLGSHEDSQENVVLFFELLFPNPVLHLNRPQVLDRVVTLRRAPGSRYLPPPPAMGLEVIHDLLSGIEALHNLGLVHNDVKLANFLVAIDHPSPEIDDWTYFRALATSAYHGVLIDGGGVRSLDVLEEMNRGKEDPSFPPVELTPIYAPPEALIGLKGDAAERPHYSTAIDVYEAALVAYSTITGYTPYAHLRKPVDMTSFPAILDLKRAERRGEVRPIDLELIKQARFQDTKFAASDTLGHAVCRAHFERDMAALLLKYVDPDPLKRGSAADMKWDLEKYFAIRLIPMSMLADRPKIGDRGQRLHRQRQFAVEPDDPRSRLNEAAGRKGAAAGVTPERLTRRLGSLWEEEEV